MMIPESTSNSEHTRYSQFVLLLLTGLYLVLLSSCRLSSQSGNTNSGISFGAQGRDHGKPAVPFTGAMPRGWPPGFTAPPDCLWAKDSVESNLVDLIVKSNPEAVYQYCQAEFDKLGISTTRIDETTRSGITSIIIKFSFNNTTMFITVLENGYNVVTTPTTAATDYLVIRLNSKTPP